MDAPISFSGSITEPEGWQLDQLLRGTTTRPVDTRQLVLCVVLGMLIAGFLGYEAIVYEEPEQLLYIGLGCLVVAMVALQSWSLKRNIQRWKRNGEGMFAALRGHVTEDGIEYLIGQLPVRYRWDDFVGCRLSDDTLVLYLAYPRDVNPLAASLFDSPDHWRIIKSTVQRNVPRLGRFPQLQKRHKSQRWQYTSAGARALDKRDWRVALHSFDKALSLEPSDAQALQGHFIAAVALQEFDLAATSIAQIESLGPPDAITRRMRVQVLLAKEQYAKALEDLNWLIENAATDDADLWRDRGLVLLKLGQLDDALRDTSHAIEINRQDSVAWNNRGKILLELNRVDLAIENLQEAIRINPEFERPRELLATVT